MVEPHFCRDYDCFGSNPDHGYSFEEAKEDIIKSLQSEIDWWKSQTEKEYFD